MKKIIEDKGIGISVVRGDMMYRKNWETHL